MMEKEEEKEGRRSRLAASGVAPGVGRRTEGAREVSGFCFPFFLTDVRGATSYIWSWSG
jgi:hypothetical protein